MERKYTQGYVVKHRSKWRAIVKWQDDNGKQHRLTKSTGITCRPDKVDPSTGKTVPDKGNSRHGMSYRTRETLRGIEKMALRRF